MNREILFRAKMWDESKWVCGTFSYEEGGVPKIYELVWDENYHTYVPEDCDIIPESLGEYTGLTDRNGVKIFEGDIIRYCPVRDGEVKTGCVSWSENNGAYIIEVMDGSVDAFWVHTVIFGKCEIIGNVHDNPELLEGGDANG